LTFDACHHTIVFDFVAGTWFQENRTVYPESVDGGVLTFLRGVGSYTIWTDATRGQPPDLAWWQVGVDGGTLFETGLQLVPIRAGAAINRNLGNSIDMESNDWIARHTMEHPANISQILEAGGAGTNNRQLVGRTWHFDIRSKRKFDTSQWRLVWSTGLCNEDSENVLTDRYFSILRLRALFLTGPGN